MQNKNQALSSETRNLSISQAADILGWSPDTIRRNLGLFNKFPGPQAYTRTPGGHLRFLRDAVLWVKGRAAAPKTADELLEDLR